MSPNTTNVKIWWDVSVDAYRMNSPFNKALVDAMHQVIPYSDRSFDRDTKVWTFAEKYLAPLLVLLKTIGILPSVITRAQAEQAQTSSSSGSAHKGKPVDAIIVEFVKLVPYDCMLKAYRAAAMQLHPDRGGNMDKMTSLNAAWDRIQKEVYGQQ